MTTPTTAFTSLDPSTDTIGSVPKPQPAAKNYRPYKDREFKGDDDTRQELLSKSTTVYVGNLSFYTSDSQIYELFSKCGDVKRVIMGLDKHKKTPCGFCFVEYEDRESTELCINLLNRTQLDGRPLKIDLDTGFTEGRQFGRGTSGGQISDEMKDQGGQNKSVRGRGNMQRMDYMTTTIMATLTILICCIALAQTRTILPPGPGQHYPLISIASSQSHRHYQEPANSVHNLRRAQASAQGLAYEQTFAKLLVDIMKTAKPTLMQAFMRATLEDPKLKEIAINIFFNATSNDS